MGSESAAVFQGAAPKAGRWISPTRISRHCREAERTKVSVLWAELEAAALAAGRRGGQRGGEALMATWRHTAIRMSCQLSGSSALSPFNSKSSGKEISQSVKHSNYIPSKASESGTCSTRISSPLLDCNRRFGRISYSEAISECGERGMKDALADLQKNYCFFHT